MRPDGLPDLHLMFFPKSEAHVLDTWDTSGLRGTGSHDFRANGIFVPNDRSMDFVAPVSMHPGRIYNLPLATVFNSALMGAPLGVARAGECQIASNSDPLFASNLDPSSGAGRAYPRHA